MIAVAEEEPQRAAKLFGAAEAIREMTGHKRTDEEEAEEAQFMSRLRAMLSRSGIQCALGGGQVHDDGAGDPVGVELRNS